MGELHLDILIDRLLREFKVDAKIGKPQVAYKETIQDKVRCEGKFIKQTGGRGQYGHVVLEIEPNQPGKGYEFESAIVGGVIPKQFIKPISDGIREALGEGVIAGYPLVDIKATLIDGSYHDVDSSDIAFKIAGTMAMRDGVARANPVLLEPIMGLEVITPQEYLGDVVGDLKMRRAKVKSMHPRPDGQVIDAVTPLSEMFGYATRLRSITQGRAIFTMQFSRYEKIPEEIAEKLLKQFRGY